MRQFTPRGSTHAEPQDRGDKGALRLDFDSRLLLRFRGSTITSDAGLLVPHGSSKPIWLPMTTTER
jgi:hypothetical protein